MLELLCRLGFHSFKPIRDIERTSEKIEGIYLTRQATGIHRAMCNRCGLKTWPTGYFNHTDIKTKF